MAQQYKTCYIIYNEQTRLYIMNEQLQTTNDRRYAMEIHFTDTLKANNIQRRANDKFHTYGFRTWKVKTPIN